MKPAQWVAVVILALMVGGITFAMVYIGGGKNSSGDSTSREVPTLTFGDKKYPPPGAPALISEVNQQGTQAFWFTNAGTEPVTVGLNSKSCQCSEVELGLLPESSRERLVSASVAPIAAASHSPLRPLALDLVCVAACGQDMLGRAAREMAEPAGETTAVTTDSSTTVPPGALGWVRLKWVGDKPTPRILHADLWMGQKGGSRNAVVEAGAMIVPPLMADKEVAVGTLNTRDLEKPRTLWFHCWSVTRPSFRLEAERANEGAQADADPVEVGTPQLLTESERRRLDEALYLVRARCGYRIPVTLKARAKDGTPIEMGHFRRFVTLKSEDVGGEPVRVEISGVIQGDVTVGSPKEAGTIGLGVFKSSEGARGNILLETNPNGPRLELDRSRVPEFVKVRFPTEPEVGAVGGRKLWLLEVEVPPGAASGRFPRQDDPAFRDSAIYVKTAEAPPRFIRIPLQGMANEG